VTRIRGGNNGEKGDGGDRERRWRSRGRCKAGAPVVTASKDRGYGSGCLGATRELRL
jgi:hypothetical protein